MALHIFPALKETINAKGSLLRTLQNSGWQESSGLRRRVSHSTGDTDVKLHSDPWRTREDLQ